MSLDALCLSAVRSELFSKIQGMKIDKVQQPESDMILLSLRNARGQVSRLLLSAGTGDARIHLTNFKFDNPKAPPMFCMLLRKHITGARIIDVTQPPAERALTLVLEAYDAIGYKSEKRITIEMIGRLSNIILSDSDGIIIDCLRRIGGELSEKRSVLPGLLYRNPPPQEGKLDPYNITNVQLHDLIRKAIDSKSANAVTVDKWLLSTFSAFSPLLCREITWRAYAETDYRFATIKDDGAALVKSFLTLMEKVKANDYEPWLITTNDNKPHAFSFTRIMQYEKICKAKRAESFSSMLDEHFTRSSKEKRMSQRCAATLKTINSAHNKLVRKLAVQSMELDETSKRDYLRECGDIITTNLHLLKKGQQILTAEDFYSTSSELREIKLDPLKSPQQNAAKYYKAYTKAKNAQKFLTEQIKNGEKELEYIESIIEQIKRVENEHDLNEVRSELSLSGYIKTKKSQKEKPTESSPLRFLSKAGIRIFAGRNNLQNDKLTLKTASKFDIWLHAQKIHGAHVIISNAGVPPDEGTLCEAASIAAYYSAARKDIKVPVDYTMVKNVKKPSGGRPGMVIYSDFKTITATPDEELANRLRD